MAKIVIAELDFDIQSLLKTTSELKKQIDVLKNSQKELAASGQSTSEAFVENEAVLKSLNSAYTNNIKVITESGKATAQQANQAELLNLALTKEATSIAEAREQNKLLNKLRNETNTTTKEGQAQLAALNKKLDENNAFIKANADAYLKQKINIGNYKEDIKSALSELNLFNGGLQQFGTVGKVASIGFKIIGDQAKAIKASFNEAKEASTQVANGMQNISNSSKDAEKTTIGFTLAQKAQSVATTASTTATAAALVSLKVFRLALISTGIGALVVALGSLITFLSTSKEGIDAVTSVTRPLKAIFDALLGVTQQVGKYLFEAFKNPKQALIDLGNFVKQNLINRFTAFGEILRGIISLDFKRVTNGVLQAGTGVQNLTGKIGAAAKATGKFLDDAAKKGAQIDALNKSLERSQLAFQRAQIKTNDAIDQQLLISKDTSKSFAERAKAANEIIRLTTDLSKKEENIVKTKMSILKLEQSSKSAKALTIAEQQKQVDLEKELDAAQDRGINARIEQSRVLSGLRKEQNATALAATQKQKEADKKAAEDKKAATEKEAADKLSLAKAELDLFLATEKSKLEGAKFLTDELIKEEEKRLKEIEKRKLAQLAKEKNIDANKIEEKKLNNQALTQAEIEYETQRIILAGETDKTIQNNKQILEEQIKQQKADQLIAQKEIDLANAQTQFEEDMIRAQQVYDAELAQLKTNLEAKKITQDQYDEKKRQADINKAEMERLAGITSVSTKLKEMQQIAQGLEGLFGKNKAIAAATALINGGLAVTEILKTPSILPEPIASISRGVQIAGVVGTTARNISQIKSAKFEQGGIQEIGGNRHSQGGTKFYGEDGTMFEAERGEGIGILNRSAYAAFMDFNNSFGNGRSGNGLFAGGGIITQGVKPQTADMSSIIDAIANMPAPVVAVEEIQTVGNRYVKVKQNADF